DLTPTPVPGATAQPTTASSGGSGFFGLPGGGTGGAQPTPNDATPTPPATGNVGGASTPDATPTAATTLPAPLLLGCTIGTGASSKQVTCNFNAVPSAQSYQLTRSTNANSSFTQVATVNAPNTQVVDTSV